MLVGPKAGLFARFGSSGVGALLVERLEEKRKLVQLFERSTRARSHELRALEIALHAAVFAAG